MKNRLLSVAIVVNGVACALFAGALLYAETLLPVASNMRVTELDRAGVFQIERLRAYDPVLATNLRNNLGPFITRKHQEALVSELICGLVVSGSTVVLLAWSWASRKHQEPSPLARRDP